VDPYDKAKNAHCPLCMATDSVKPYKNPARPSSGTPYRNLSGTHSTQRNSSTRTYYHNYVSYVEHSNMVSSTTPNVNTYGKVHGRKTSSHHLPTTPEPTHAPARGGQMPPNHNSHPSSNPLAPSQPPTPSKHENNDAAPPSKYTTTYKNKHTQLFTTMHHDFHT
jgi:hypothetical protein